MSILLALFIGAVIGVIAGFILREGVDHLIINAVLGIAGAVFGLGLYYLNSSAGTEGSLFSGRGILCSLVGALLFVLLFNLLHKSLPQKTDPAKQEDSKNSDDD